MFNDRLKELRESQKISQAKFAKIIGVAASTVGMWESGKRNPDYEMLNKIAHFFNVSTDFLLLDESQNKSHEPETIKPVITDDPKLFIFYKTNIESLIKYLKNNSILNAADADKIEINKEIEIKEPAEDIRNHYLDNLKDGCFKTVCTREYLTNSIDRFKQSIFNRYHKYFSDLLIENIPSEIIELVKTNITITELKEKLISISGQDLIDLADYYTNNYFNKMFDEGIDIITKRIYDSININGKLRLIYYAEDILKIKEYTKK